jgi:hypothetical protein
MMQRSSSLLLLLVCTACLLLIPGCLSVRYEGAKADYMNNDIKAFRLDDVEWMIYKDEKTGMAYFYNSVTKGVQWSDPRRAPATSWADTWHIITACAFVPPLIFMVVLGVRVWYIKVCYLAIDCVSEPACQQQQGPGDAGPSHAATACCTSSSSQGTLCAHTSRHYTCNTHLPCSHPAHASQTAVLMQVSKHPPPPLPAPPPTQAICALP